MHGALDPSKIFLSEFNSKCVEKTEVKVADFGYSALIKSVPASSQYLQQYHEYQAPELRVED